MVSFDKPDPDLHRRMLLSKIQGILLNFNQDGLRTKPFPDIDVVGLDNTTKIVLSDSALKIDWGHAVEALEQHGFTLAREVHYSDNQEHVLIIVNGSVDENFDRMFKRKVESRTL